MSGKHAPRWPLWLGISVFIVFAGGAFADGCPWCILPQEEEPGQDVANAGELIRGAPLNAPKEEPEPAPIEIPEAWLTDPEVTPKKDTEPVQPKPEVAEEGRYRSVAWEKLAGFTYEYPSGDLKDPNNLKDRQPYPEDVKALDKKECAVTGFMVPVDVEGDKVLTFYLVRTPFSCCYGQPPQMNEYIYVVMDKEHPADYKSHSAITVYGTMAVEEEIENGAVLSLYQIAGQEVAAPIGVK